ncbi:conserved hypothetical protein [Trichinella spiralis]|uniref:hypothetical protein n=1 Tax=Trichinella spiralis TaxID=6334 RepID=UPI0001EFD5F5|nr:conserved hypothetical protein [Trichinella spiralis]
MNVHITASPYSRFSVMIVRKKLFRCFTAVKLCSALAQSIGSPKMIKIEELGHLIAWHYCGVKELRIPLYVLGNGIPLFIYMGVVMLSLTLPNKRRSAAFYTCFYKVGWAPPYNPSKDDMHECHYICAPPLVATNKVTDHKRGILQYCMIVSSV